MRKYSLLNSMVLIVILLFGCTKKKSPDGPDTTPPTVAGVVSLDTTKVLVSFSESVKSEMAMDTLNYFIQSYETLNVHLVEIDPMKKNCILITEPQESTLYDITIAQIEDLSGNKMVDTSLTFQGMGVQVDSLKPSVSITEPMEGDTLYGFEYIVATAGDNQAVKKVSIYIDDSLICEDWHFPFYTLLDVRGLPEGEFLPLYATAEDFSANIGHSETLDVFIGYHPPYPYVILDTINTNRTPFMGDMTEDGTKVFFVQTDTGGKDLTMINTVTNTVERNEPIFTGPSYYLDVYGNEYVFFTTGSSFSIYDIFLDQTIETVNVDGDPTGIVCSSGEKLYIARNSMQDVLVYSIQLNSIIDTIPVSGDPRGMAIDTLHGALYVCLYDQNLISVIDVGTDTVSTNVSLSGKPFEIAFSPDFDRAYVTELDNGAFGVIETASHTLINEVYPPNCVFPKGIAVTNGGDYLFLGSSYEILVLNTFDYTVEWKIDVGLYPWSIVYSPLFNRVYAVCMGGHAVFCIGD
jgi:YVTN family beta-propeller protein